MWAQREVGVLFDGALRDRDVKTHGRASRQAHNRFTACLRGGPNVPSLLPRSPTAAPHAWPRSLRGLLGVLLLSTAQVWGQVKVGSLRGVVLDGDFDVPLAEALVVVQETGATATSGELGNYLIADLAPGTYSVSISREGFVRQLRGDVVITAGQLTELDVALLGDYEDMPELVVQDLQLGGGSDAQLADLRVEVPQLLSSISSELMSQAGASDAASALRLVPGATIANGKFAVIRGLPDRYVSSQLNGVRLPSADEDTRAVELDQFPAVVIESIQVSKTFTPNQQGDASGGAVDVRLNSIPEEGFFRISATGSVNENVYGEDGFLSYDGGGVSTLGKETKDIQWGNLGGNWKGAVGSKEEDAPRDFKWSLATGGKRQLDSGWTVGGFASLYYERDSQHVDDKVEDAYWVFGPGQGLTPQTNQGTPSPGGDFKTSLFDIVQSSRSVQWGGLGTLGLESDHHRLGLTYLYTHSAEDKVTLATDTRGKAHFFPGYDPDDPFDPGNAPGELLAAPYLRTETLEYTERTTDSLQLSGHHEYPARGFELWGLDVTRPEVDWYVARSTAALDQPDKRQFGSTWTAPSYFPGFPPFVPPYVTPAEHGALFPGANVNLGNFQRIWKSIEEQSDQYGISLTLPFSEHEQDGSLRFGTFHDDVEREFDQDTFANFGDSGSVFEGDFDEPWSEVFGDEDHPLFASEFDVDYHGEQRIDAWYGMIDLPLSERWTLMTGARFESTSIEVINDPEDLALWTPPGGTTEFELEPGDADVDFSRRDLLPSLGVEYRPTDEVTVRGAVSRTVARQTFKELTPIQQQEFVGGPVFIGNPELDMSELVNYDLRADYKPTPSSLVSMSLFHKDIEDPIENVQRIANFTYTTVENYPEGTLRGWELELRQGLGDVWERMDGITVGANMTRIRSEVDLPKAEIDNFADPSIDIDLRSRDMTNAPDFLYNLYANAQLEDTRISLFWTVTGDRLVAGAGQANGNFVPNVYAKEFGALNLGITHALSESTQLSFRAKNLTDPEIEEVYRFRGVEQTKSSFTRGREFSLGYSGRF